MIAIEHKSDCSGCHACMAACPEGAVTMEADGEGFLYPRIDPGLCVDCGICDTMCQAIQPIQTQRKPAAYACWNNDEAVRMNSSSGGMFHLLARWVIEKGGIVFGAAFDDDFMVRHIAVDSVDQIPLMQGSKYVQSVIGDVYVQAGKLLEAGRYVLFAGTPCQIDGLLHYLRKDYERLYTQDIICHGVPSPLVWKTYLEYQTKRFNASLKREPLPSFRQKAEGWKRYSISLHFNKDIEYRRYHRDDTYMQAFLGNFSLRPSCCACRSKTKNRNSDITLADFWGVEMICPEMFDDKGTSMVFANSEKGKWLFEQVKNQMTWREVDFEESVSRNTPAFRSVEQSPKREDFFARLGTMPFDQLVRKELLPPVHRRVYWKVRRCVGAVCRKCGIIRR